MKYLFYNLKLKLWIFEALYWDRVVEKHHFNYEFKNCRKSSMHMADLIYSTSALEFSLIAI